MRLTFGAMSVDVDSGVNECGVVKRERFNKYQNGYKTFVVYNNSGVSKAFLIS